MNLLNAIVFNMMEYIDTEFLLKVPEYINVNVRGEFLSLKAACQTIINIFKSHGYDI